MLVLCMQGACLVRQSILHLIPVKKPCSGAVVAAALVFVEEWTRSALEVGQWAAVEGESRKMPPGPRKSSWFPGISAVTWPIVAWVAVWILLSPICWQWWFKSFGSFCRHLRGIFFFPLAGTNLHNLYGVWAQLMLSGLLARTPSHVFVFITCFDA